jgi:hypothetical protein
VVRLLPDGSLDPTFSIGTGPNGLGVKVQADGKIILAGSFDSFFNGVLCDK